MNKRFLFCILGMILTLPAYADPVTVTSRDYVDTTVGARQNKIEATSGDSVVTYSTTAGQTGSRAILDDLSGTTTTDINMATAMAAEIC